MADKSTTETSNPAADVASGGFSMFSFSILGLLIMACLIIGPGGLGMYERHLAQQAFDKEWFPLAAELQKTEAGKFAVDKFVDCKNNVSFLSRRPTGAACVIETVEIANILHGHEFSGAVSFAVVPIMIFFSSHGQ